MSDINRIILEDSSQHNPDDIFTGKKPNESAKYFPKFLNKAKQFQKKIVDKLDLKSILSINPKVIPGMDSISVDANDDERTADNLLKKSGRLT